MKSLGDPISENSLIFLTGTISQGVGNNPDSPSGTQ